MALEALLPSEVARLVYGYLIDEKCMETAKLFLNESPNLEECRAVLSYGKHFTTRVCGYALLDILEKFCLLSSILQEKVGKFDNSDKLKHCGDIIGQIKILLEEYKCKGQQNVHTNTSSQDPPINPTESSGKFHKRNYLVKDDVKLKSSANIYNEEYKSQIQTNQCQVPRNRELEATPLKTLPGYTNNLEIKNSQSHKIKSPKKSRVVLKTDSILHNEVVNTNLNLQKVQKEGESLPKQRINGLNKDIFISTAETNFEKHKNSEVQTSELTLGNVLDKIIMTDTEKSLKSYKSTEVQTSDIGSPCSESSPANECIKLLGNVTGGMINRTEIHEKIAENINKILDPRKSNVDEKPFEGTKEQSTSSFLLAFDKAVQLAMNKTENDPDFLNILNENFLPSEEVSSTEDEGDVNTSISEDNFQKEINVHSECKTSRNNAEVITASSENDKDVFEVMRVENHKENNKASSTKHMENENVIDPVMTKQNDTAKNPNDPVDSKIVEVKNFPKKQFKVPISHEQNSQNSKTLLNTLESPILQQKSEHKIDHFFNQNNTITSTPLKNEIHNFDTCDWFPTQDLVTSNVIYHKEGIYTACETTSATHLSPIIALDKSAVEEKATTISYSTTNALKDQTLHTPEIVLPSRNGSLMNTAPIFTKYLVPKNKTPGLQKSSDATNILLNTQISQKSIENSENVSQLLKDHEYNKYFNVDSLMLYGIDNNISTIPATMSVPEIEVEDSLTFTGTGLSPFIKVIKKSDEPDAINEQTKTEGIPTVSNAEVLKPSNKIDEYNEEIKITSIIKVYNSDILTKNTPKDLLEDRSKNNRLSLSTPKKPNHHVRAIDFDAATYKSQSEGKLKNSDNLDHEAIMKNLKDACKSSLFQSPPFTNSELIDQNATSNITHISSGTTDSANIRNININKPEDNEKAKIYPISEKDLEKKGSNSKTGEVNKTTTEKKSWDSDLRKYLSEAEVSRPVKRKYTAKSKEKDESKRSRKSESMLKKVKKSDNKSSPRKWKKSKKSGRDKEKKDSVDEKKKDESKENEDRIEEKEKDDSKNSKKSSSKKSKKSNKSKDSDRDRKKDDKSSSERVSSSKSEKKNESKSLKSEKQKELKSSKSEKQKESKSSMPEIDKSHDSDKEKKKSEIKLMSQETPNHTLLNISEKDKESESSKAPEHEKTEETKVKSENSENRDEKTIRDPLEEMLSNGINDIANEDDVVKLASEEMHNLSKLSKNETVISYSAKQKSEILVKMQQDEESMSVAFETIACDLKIKYFPENNSKLQESTVVPQSDIVSTTKPTVDCDILEMQLSQLISPASGPKSSPQEVIYDRVNKVECGRVVEKKYARLKTLDKNIKHKRTPKCSPFKGFTPHKLDGTLHRPPTPLVMSPSSSISLLAPPALSKLNEDSRTIPGLVAHTPSDCPTTPTIVLTPPKTVEEKKPIDNQRETTSYYPPLPITFEVSKKSEITQFEVIKENLPKDAKTKSQSTVENANEDVAKQSKLMSYRDQENVSNNESNDESSSDSSSSASSCGECSCDDCSPSIEVNSTGVTPPSVKIEQVVKVENIINTESEVSPTKVFKLNKTDKEIAETIQETPAKDENAEVDIFDTPSVSKPITENPTNLNAKISEMMIRKEREELERQQKKLKPAIATVERVLPKVVTKPISQLMKALPLNIQMTAMEVKKESDRSAILQRIKMKNSDEEVAKAVESITALEREKLNVTLEKSITPSPMDQNEQQNPLTNAELARAIRSIANTDRSRNVSTSSGSQVLELVLEETEEDDDDEHHPQQQQQQQQRQPAPHRQWGDYHCVERSPVEHIEVVGKKKRRKKFSRAELECSILRDGMYHSLVPTDFDILLEVKDKVVRKKREVTTKVTTTKSKKKTVVRHDEESRDSVASSTDNCSNVIQAIFTDNRKRPLSENQEIVKNKKPKTNMFIL